jgi:hypothetical protein
MEVAPPVGRSVPASGRRSTDPQERRTIMTRPNQPKREPERREEQRDESRLSYTPQNRTDQEGEPKKVAREGPDYTPQGRADNA